jgi:carboxyl-terminal processing protease
LLQASSRFPGKLLGPVALLIGFLLLTASSQGAGQSPGTNPWRKKALDAEKRGAWLQACRCWDEILRKDRTNSVARDGYQRCLRRLQLVARHSDPVYRKLLARMGLPRALTTYQQVLVALTMAYPDRSRTDLTQLFNQGLQEARLALDDPVFAQHYLAGVKPEALSAFKVRLAGLTGRKISRPPEAREQVYHLLKDLGRGAFGSALAMEFAAGACNTLDEYSSFVTPAGLGIVQTAVRGKLAGIGVDVAVADDALVITRVYPKSPAQEADLHVGDRITRIDRQPVAGLTSDAAAEKLRGDPGTMVAVEYERRDPTKDVEKRTLPLKRRPVVLPAVEPALVQAVEGGVIAHLRINYFNDNTMVEVKEALAFADRDMEGRLKGVILDLRGNPGGVYPSAVSVAALFLPGGVISISQGSLPENTRTYRGEGPGEFHLLPVVILIDGETASSAEVLTVALKEGRPTTLRILGQPSFGKGTVQRMVHIRNSPLEKLTGIRLTVARLFSPSNVPLSKGITPDVKVSDTSILDRAREELLELINPKPPVGPTMMAKNDMQ